MTQDSLSLSAEMEWLETVVRNAIAAAFADLAPADLPDIAPPPDLWRNASRYERLVNAASLGIEARLVFALSLAPLVSPAVLDPFFLTNPAIQRGFTEFGGLLPALGGFRPGIATAQFLLGGRDLSRRLAALAHFRADAPLYRSGLLRPVSAADRDGTDTPLRPSHATCAQLFDLGGSAAEMDDTFPARPLDTKLAWSDLVLPEDVLYEVEEILAWMLHGPRLLADPHVGPRLKPGYRSLFHGPSGTGKTVAAALLGKRAERDVYRVDLSMIVSKWIGETEKNLARVFDRAEGRNCILFFDEADALFGKRTNVSHANDRHANQEVSYILQRIEDFDGVVILASNLRGNIDAAFSRRFQSVIEFPLPGPVERLRLWTKAFPDRKLLCEDVDLTALASTFEITGGEISNVLRSCLLDMYRGGRDRLTQSDLALGVAREARKSGRYGEVNL